MLTDFMIFQFTLFIIHHIISSFIGNVLINVALGSFISLLECSLSLLTQGSMLIGRSLELGFLKCVFVQYEFYRSLMNIAWDKMVN